MTPEEVKAHLMAQAEAMIDELLARKPQVEDITLGEIEQLAMESGRDFREAVLKSLAEESSQSEVREAMRCPACGQAMHYKGKRGKDVVTEAGEIHVERDYYYCPHCQRGLFPPGPAVAVE
jgi:uncharacterized protein with PIN domain